MPNLLRALLLTYLVAGVVIIGTDAAMGPISHRLVYGYWFPHFREITRADVECVPPSTIKIKIGEYTTIPAAVIDWCGFRAEYEGRVTFQGSRYRDFGATTIQH